MPAVTHMERRLLALSGDDEVLAAVERVIDRAVADYLKANTEP